MTHNNKKKLGLGMGCALIVNPHFIKNPFNQPFKLRLILIVIDIVAALKNHKNYK
ncbi:hypothetical protein Sps_04490 [Shewanella psychrophila]|uniref:Uncharacterized protein n=1 Tax=Shewanella psychrophila TaxID=225848 RepID=A0A1S6HVJ1_9GAMM|nr:hypothetical protein Sps_04490 [Shewanella psychrophila]